MDLIIIVLLAVSAAMLYWPRRGGSSTRSSASYPESSKSSERREMRNRFNPTGLPGSGAASDVNGDNLLPGDQVIILGGLMRGQTATIVSIDGQSKVWFECRGSRLHDQGKLFDKSRVSQMSQMFSGAMMGSVNIGPLGPMSMSIGRPDHGIDSTGKTLSVGDEIEVNGRGVSNFRTTVVGFDPDGDIRFTTPSGDVTFISSSQVTKCQPVPPAPAKPKVTMESVILADDKKEAIQSALSQVEHFDKIFTEWGFGDTFEKGTAVSLLFWGVPGTGKTLMAQAIADSLDAELKLYGAGEIETAEPGGAERNIKQIFAEAQKTSGGKDIKQVICFDECDSLLMDRNTVGPILGATINCLLSEIERYSGVVIFTTNRFGKLDPALERRLSAKIEFTFPDQAQREAIWRRMIPAKAPLEDEVDFTALAAKALAGGGIKNAVLNAARRAAHAGHKKLTQADFITSADLELSAKEDYVRQAEAQDTTRLEDYGRGDRGGVTKQGFEQAIGTLRKWTEDEIIKHAPIKGRIN